MRMFSAWPFLLAMVIIVKDEALCHLYVHPLSHLGIAATTVGIGLLVESKQKVVSDKLVVTLQMMLSVCEQLLLY